jgi:hypothetical protein
MRDGMLSQIIATDAAVIQETDGTPATESGERCLNAYEVCQPVLRMADGIFSSIML